MEGNDTKNKLNVSYISNTSFFPPPAHLEDFIADFNLPVLLFGWILTDIVNVPAIDV